MAEFVPTPEQKVRFSELFTDLGDNFRAGKVNPQWVLDGLKDLIRRSIPPVPAGVEDIPASGRRFDSLINTHFQKHGSERRFTFSFPAIPHGLTSVHLEVLCVFFEGNLQLMVIPTLKKIDNLDEEYTRVMYPEKESFGAKRNQNEGLISFRPDVFGRPAGIPNYDFHHDTWQAAYWRAMREELSGLSKTAILVETIQKPNYTDGSQHYGTREGRDNTQDPLLPLIKEVFGRGANRFNHPWDKLTSQFIPRFEQAIRESFTQANLPIPGFKAILCPVFVFNLQTTLYQPENSQTNTWEWTSTTLTDFKGQDTGRRLGAGNSNRGGASGIDFAPRCYGSVDRGFRLAIVFPKEL